MQHILLYGIIFRKFKIAELFLINKYNIIFLYRTRPKTSNVLFIKIMQCQVALIFLHQYKLNESKNSNIAYDSLLLKEFTCITTCVLSIYILKMNFHRKNIFFPIGETLIL